MVRGNLDMQVTVYNVHISANGYSYYKDYVKVYDKTRYLATALGVDLEPFIAESWGEEFKSYSILPSSTFVVNKETLLELTVGNFEFKVTGQVKVAVNIQEAFEEVENRQVNIMEGTSTVYNNKCDVHMPGNMLAMYNDVLLLEDSCTDALQSALVQGWRIIAACPQPDKRRPDYILGRWNPDKDNREDSAARQA